MDGRLLDGMAGRHRRPPLSGQPPTILRLGSEPRRSTRTVVATSPAKQGRRALARLQDRHGSPRHRGPGPLGVEALQGCGEGAEVCLGQGRLRPVRRVAAKRWFEDRPARADGARRPASSGQHRPARRCQVEPQQRTPPHARSHPPLADRPADVGHGRQGRWRRAEPLHGRRQPADGNPVSRSVWSGSGGKLPLRSLSSWSAMSWS
jgi:hypothetical protein